MGVSKSPDFDGVDLECGCLALLIPGVVPGALCVVECVDGMSVGVGPRLPSNAVGKVSGSSADGDVEDDVELFVERRVLVRRIRPGVLVGLGKVAEGPEVLGDVVVHDDVLVVVEIGVHAILGPDEAEGVKLVIEGSGGETVGGVGFLVGVGLVGGAEV